MGRMSVLVGCEYSGTVRNAFADAGHDAWSCDLIASDDNSNKHVIGDVADVIKSRHWDIILIFPPCTAICVSGNRWYGEGQPKHDERQKAVKWTVDLWNLATSVCDHVAMENPVGVLPKMAALKPTQYIQPWQFGHAESKKTGLWLHGLPKLCVTNDVKKEFDNLPANLKHKIHYMPPSDDRWKKRSVTYAGVAQAMAKQWSIAVGGKASRDKGKRGEREAAAALREVLGIEARRGVQYQGGPDSPDVSTELDSQLHIEVKRTERLSLWDALDQAQEDAGDRPAMVLHRKNGKRWVVIHYLDDMPAIAKTISKQEK